MTNPIRIQLRRTKGWRMPPNTVTVARPSQWGNPWRVGSDGDAEYCAEQYRRCIAGERFEAWPGTYEDNLAAVNLPTAEDARSKLAGKNLACWCAIGDPCHADALLAIANGDSP